MIDVGIVCGSEEQAKAIVIGVDTVYVHTDIKQIEDEDGNIMYQYHEVQYGKDEYIKLMSENLGVNSEDITTTQIAVAETYGEMDDLKKEVTDTQIALAEVIEIILGGE